MLSIIDVCFSFQLKRGEGEEDDMYLVSGQQSTRGISSSVKLPRGLKLSFLCLVIAVVLLILGISKYYPYLNLQNKYITE